MSTAATETQPETAEQPTPASTFLKPPELEKKLKFTDLINRLVVIHQVSHVPAERSPFKDRSGEPQEAWELTVSLPGSDDPEKRHKILNNGYYFVRLYQFLTENPDVLPVSLTVKKEGNSYLWE